MMAFCVLGGGDITALETLPFEATQVADIFKGTPFRLLKLLHSVKSWNLQTVSHLLVVIVFTD